MKRFKVLNDDFVNTGGHIMCHVTEVYDELAEATRFVIIGENLAVLSAVDYIHNAVDDDIDQYVVASMELDNLTNVTDTFDTLELFKECQFKYITAYCKMFNTRMQMSYEEFPAELVHLISAECIKWHEENGQYFSTDGTDCQPSPYYNDLQKEKAREALQRIKDFRASLIEYVIQAPVAEMYDSYICIEFNGQTCEVPFGADQYHTLLALVENYIADYE